MNQFDHRDFAANPGKYLLFKTARISSNIITRDGENDLEIGQFVAISYLRNAWNQLRRREEPVYTVTVNGSVWGCLYANALCDFVL